MQMASQLVNGFKYLSSIGGGWERRELWRVGDRLWGCVTRFCCPWTAPNSRLTWEGDAFGARCIPAGSGYSQSICPLLAVHPSGLGLASVRAMNKQKMEVLLGAWGPRTSWSICSSKAHRLVTRTRLPRALTVSARNTMH